MEKNCPSATLSITNLTTPDLGSNRCRLSGNPAAMAKTKGALSYVLTFQGVDLSDYGLLGCEILCSWHLGPQGAGSMLSQNGGINIHGSQPMRPKPDWFVTCFTMLSASQHIQHWMGEWLVKSELEGNIRGQIEIWFQRLSRGNEEN